MYRRELMRCLTTTASIGSLVQARNQKTENQETSLSLPERREGWSEYEAISSPADGRYDWTGVIAQRIDLKQDIAEYADSPPSLFSYFAANVSFPDNLRPTEARTSVDVTTGGSLLPVSIRVDRIGEYIESHTCGLDPHPSEVKNFAQGLFIDRSKELHRFDEEVSIEEGLRKDISPFCVNSRSYSKTQYLDYQYTIESKWEAEESDDLEDVNFKGYLSIEQGEADYLLVGGVVPDEEIGTGVLGTKILGEGIVRNEAKLAHQLIDMMEKTSLTN